MQWQVWGVEVSGTLMEMAGLQMCGPLLQVGFDPANAGTTIQVSSCHVHTQLACCMLVQHSRLRLKLMWTVSVGCDGRVWRGHHLQHLHIRPESASIWLGHVT